MSTSLKTIGVSFFGINDSITLTDEDGNIVTIKENDNLPNVIIKNKEEKVTIYDSDAKEERTGIGIYDELENQDGHSARIPVAMLWKSIHLESDNLKKNIAAVDLVKYISIKIVELLNKHDPNVKVNLNSLKQNYKIVLAIPDYCTEEEQDCLIRAFAGFNISLIWRSIAALMDLIYGDLKEKKELFDLYPSDEIAVIYVGPDDINYTSYKLDSLGVSKRKYIPIRKKAFYEDASININGFDIASIAAINQLKRTYPKGTKINLNDLNQVVYKCPEVWNVEYDSQNTIKEPICHFDFTNQSYKWYFLRNDAFRLFYNFSFTIEDLKLIRLFWENQDLEEREFFEQFIEYERYPISSFLKEQLEDAIESDDISVRKIFLVGPLAHSSYYQEVISLLNNEQDITTLHLDSISKGANIFWNRVSRNEVTYKDVLKRLSMVAVDNYEYVATPLIDDSKPIDPTDEYTTKPIPFGVQSGSNSIELYVSSDPKFTTENLEKVEKLSFEELGIEVEAATAWVFDTLVKKDFKVEISVQQKVLSGLTKVIINPIEENDFISNRIITKFDPLNKKIFKGKLDVIERPYLPYKYWDKIFSENEKEDIIYSQEDIKQAYENYETFANCLNEWANSIDIPESIIPSLVTKFKKAYKLIPETKKAHILLDKIRNNYQRDRNNLLDLQLKMKESKFNDTRLISASFLETKFNKIATDTKHNALLYLVNYFNRPIKGRERGYLYNFLYNHHKILNEKSDDFVLNAEIAPKMALLGFTLLKEGAENFVKIEPDLINNTYHFLGIKKLSKGALILLFALMYRSDKKEGKSFLKDPVIEIYDQELGLCNINISTECKLIRDKIADKFYNDIEYNMPLVFTRYRQENKRKMIERLLKNIDDLIKYLDWKGTSLNIVEQLKESGDGEE